MQLLLSGGMVTYEEEFANCCPECYKNSKETKIISGFSPVNIGTERMGRVRGSVGYPCYPKEFDFSFHIGHSWTTPRVVPSVGRALPHALYLAVSSVGKVLVSQTSCFWPDGPWPVSGVDMADMSVRKPLQHLLIFSCSFLPLWGQCVPGSDFPFHLGPEIPRYRESASFFSHQFTGKANSKCSNTKRWGRGIVIISRVS